MEDVLNTVRPESPADYQVKSIQGWHLPAV